LVGLHITRGDPVLQAPAPLSGAKANRAFDSIRDVTWGRSQYYGAPLPLRPSKGHNPRKINPTGPGGPRGRNTRHSWIQAEQDKHEQRLAAGTPYTAAQALKQTKCVLGRC
jgi:hypothetical protein